MTDGNGIQTFMPVGPTNNDGFMGGGGFSAWWILIFLVFFGWGNGGWGANGNNGVGSEVQRGFDQNAVMNGINGLNSTLTNGFAGLEASANARQMAEMNQNFTLQSAMQNCCCENRAATADLKYTVANEACTTRTANAANTQAILDKLCQLEMDGYKQQLAGANDTINQLRTQLLVANNQASQTAQTAQILANNEAQTVALERYLAPTPMPAYIVANPNCCQQSWNGCAA